ncbi:MULTISPECIES: hypothetical protein [Streptomyces]|uniref:hypothetical protein n=1 Tax=Streptomyces TaxID=1883 RepID=UPI000B0A350E|nr:MULTISPECIES: hypothetical protein [Streptomyces]MDX2920921.1 hypothetical protein [Streptomyces sp. NE06-03C]MDX3610441.1 hypothetical protein [Streptomyces sp. FL06-04B]MDX3735991.1 hypothetical protein [Streptomyces sp. ID01-15D]
MGTQREQNRRHRGRQALLADPPEGGVRSAAVGFLRHRLIQKCSVVLVGAAPVAPGQ